MKFLCNIFGHKFSYYIRNANENENIRFCRRCGLAQEYKIILGALVWVSLVQRTLQGAIAYFGPVMIRIREYDAS